MQLNRVEAVLDGAVKVLLAGGVGDHENDDQRYGDAGDDLEDHGGLCVAVKIIIDRRNADDEQHIKRDDQNNADDREDKGDQGQHAHDGSTGRGVGIGVGTAALREHDDESDRR